MEKLSKKKALAVGTKIGTAVAGMGSLLSFGLSAMNYFNADYMFKKAELLQATGNILNEHIPTVGEYFDVVNQATNSLATGCVLAGATLALGVISAYNCKKDKDEELVK